MQPEDGLEGITDSVQVSILIRPEGRMQRFMVTPSVQYRVVSILIRPEGRMQPLVTLDARMPFLLFQSSSGQKAECNLRNSHDHNRLGVSILIRPEGRMQRS